MRMREILDRYDITYRQLDSWTTSGYLGNDKKNSGTGSTRDWDAMEIKVLERMLGLVKAGVKAAAASEIAKGDEEKFEQLYLALTKCQED